MVAMLRPQTDARSVVEPEPTLLRLLLRHLQPLPPPDPLDAFGVHHPAGIAQQRRNPAVAIAAVLAGERNDVRRQGGFVGAAPRHLALRRSMLSQDAARPALRHVQLRHDVLDAAATAGGA